MKKKIMILSLAILLFVRSPINCYASSGTLIVNGGTIAIGGLGAGALAGLAGPAVVAVFCGMMAMGINVELTQASEEAGMTKTEFVKSKIKDYCNEANITAGVFYKGILDGATVFDNGRIKLTDQACYQIKRFINWLQSNDDIVAPSSGSTTGEVVKIGNYEFQYFTNVYTTPNEITYNNRACYVNLTTEVSSSDSTFVNCAMAYVKSGSAYCAVAIRNDNTSFNIKEYLTGGSTTTWRSGSTIRNGYSYAYQDLSYMVNRGAIFPDFLDIGSTSIASFISSLDGSFDVQQGQTGVNNDTFTGENIDSTVLNPYNGTSVVVNPGLIGSIPVDSNAQVRVDEYLDALSRVIDGLADVTIGVVDTSTGIVVEQDVPDTVEIDPTIAREDDDPVHPDPDTPIIDTNEPINPDQNPNLVTEPLKFDLTRIFPFCIPFDIKDMINLLNAEPAAPRYDVDWHIPIANVDLEFTIDLSCWNDVASIVRKMELLSFIVGLAVITRNLIRG